jgi:7-cyano-7-deazaguanine synthase
MKKAVVLLSGGIDSATTLYWAKKQGYSCFCLIFDYGQRHKREIKSAILIAKKVNCKYQILKINLPWEGSSLLDRDIKIPKHLNTLKPKNQKIPSTYVPARNIIFLSFALSFAESINAQAIFIGAHTQDYSGYPDCRPEFYQAFNKVIVVGTKAGVEKNKIEIYTPLIQKTKAQIIKLGARLGVPFELTWSCYQGGKSPCGKCDSCYFRAKGFQEAGMKDPLISR